MKIKKTGYIVLLSTSCGYILYNVLFQDYRYTMMRHHYGYYDTVSAENFYINSVLVILSYLLILISIFGLLKNHRQLNHNALRILDQRLSKGDISIDEYKEIKNIIRK